MTDTSTSASSEELRARMVDAIVTAGHARDDRVQAAMRAVPRHPFVPQAALTDAYDPDRPVITKRTGGGTPLSCASVPSLVATMLGQLDVQPGDRILEIGAGTGYNAALLAYLTGPRGHVTTIDIDEDVTTEARRALDATGYEAVHVITRDGVRGAEENAPYDRIILTVGAWDLAPAWWSQLAPGGRMVVPLRWRGQTRSIAFRADAGTLRSESVKLCGFVPLVGHDGERTGTLDDGGHVALYWDDGQNIDVNALYGVLDQPKTPAWSGTNIGKGQSFDGVWLRLTATDPGTCRIAADDTAVSTGLCTPAIAVRSPALVDGDSLAYFTVRRQQPSEPIFELGAAGHGPNGAALAEKICDQIRAWGANRAAVPTITAHQPQQTPADPPRHGAAIHKPNAILELSY